ncbi:hypothetical protein BGZ65_010959, partial [Modicella reniformis]
MDAGGMAKAYIVLGMQHPNKQREKQSQILKERMVNNYFFLNNTTDVESGEEEEKEEEEEEEGEEEEGEEEEGEEEEDEEEEEGAALLKLNATVSLFAIRSIVAQFLNRSDLATAARVSRSWNASFIPSLYSEVHWCPELKNPLNENIITYADHIRQLHLMMDQFQLLTEHCTKLEVLHISFEGQDPDPEDWDHLSTLVRRNPRIKSIDIRDDSLEPPEAFLEALSACSPLRNLDIRMHKLDEIRMELILDTAIRLEYLRISCFKILLPKSLDKWPCFPVMKELTLDATTEVPIPIEIFRKCPKLRKFIWCEGTPGSVLDLCDLLMIHCPLIKNLKLFSESLTDLDLSLILDSCREVTSLSIYYSMFGEQAFQSLKRLFPKIQKLNIKCRGMTSAMVQQIMTSCPNLLEFSGISLDAPDLLGIAKDEVTGEQKMVTQDWICTHIQDLDIFINGLEGKPEDWHRRILQQIGRLKKLQFLTLAPDEDYNTHRSAYDGLNFSLRTG